nr:CoA transferase [Micromonospora sp. DSM 115978]
MDDRPLRGVRVLDLTNVLAGPYRSNQLLLLSAEVVKIERPGHGALARRLGPEASLNRDGIGASFLAQNAGNGPTSSPMGDSPTERGERPTASSTANSVSPTPGARSLRARPQRRNPRARVGGDRPGAS